MRMSLLLTALLLLTHPATAEQAAYDIHAIISRTGSGALLGEGQDEALKILEATVNAEGGVAGRPLHFIVHDDQSTPQTSVQIANEILATHPAFMLGPTLTATCSAVAPLVRNGPVMYCLSPGIRPERGSFAFSATIPHDGFLEAVIRYFHDQHLTRIALIMGTDSTGQDGEKAVDRAITLPGLTDTQIVERVHFNPTDVSLTAQIERVGAAHPQAIIAWTTGTAMGTVLRGLKQSNIDLPLATSTGNLLYSFMHRFAAVLPTTLIFAGGPGMLDDPRLHVDPAVRAAIKVRLAAYQKANAILDDAAETIWDPTMMAVEALNDYGPRATASQIRDRTAHLNHWPGVYGIYDFDRVPQRGLDASNAVITTWNAKTERFEAVSQPGGEPFDAN